MNHTETDLDTVHTACGFFRVYDTRSPGSYDVATAVPLRPFRVNGREYNVPIRLKRGTSPYYPGEHTWVEGDNLTMSALTKLNRAFKHVFEALPGFTETEVVEAFQREAEATVKAALTAIDQAAEKALQNAEVLITAADHAAVEAAVADAVWEWLDKRESTGSGQTAT